jgi:hypothetical protein
MRQFTVSFPDNQYAAVMEIINIFPMATIIEDKIGEIPDWIDELVQKRISNLKKGESTDYDFNLKLVKQEFKLR